MKVAIHTTLTIVLVLLGAVGASSSFAAESHYRWTDKRGNPVHSDRPPPPGTDYEVVSSGSSLVRKVNAAEGVVPAKIEPTVGNNFDQVETRPKEVKKNPEYCKRAKDNLSALDTYARIRMRNDQGEVRYIDEEEKELQREDARRAIKLNCE